MASAAPAADSEPWCPFLTPKSRYLTGFMVLVASVYIILAVTAVSQNAIEQAANARLLSTRNETTSSPAALSTSAATIFAPCDISCDGRSCDCDWTEVMKCAVAANVVGRVVSVVDDAVLNCPSHATPMWDNTAVATSSEEPWLALARYSFPKGLVRYQRIRLTVLAVNGSAVAGSIPFGARNAARVNDTIDIFDFRVVVDNFTTTANESSTGSSAITTREVWWPAAAAASFRNYGITRPLVVGEVTNVSVFPYRTEQRYFTPIDNLTYGGGYVVRNGTSGIGHFAVPSVTTNTTPSPYLLAAPTASCFSCVGCGAFTLAAASRFETRRRIPELCNIASRD